MASSSPCSSMVTTRDPVDELPEQLIREILSWLPAKSLARYKCVCNDWLDLIEDHHFLVTMHAARSTPEPIPLRYTESLDPSSTQPPETVETLDIFSGLLLELMENSEKLRLRNPVTGKILDLPNPPECYYARFHQHGTLYRSPLVCSGFDIPSRQHKLICVYHKIHNITEQQCAVLTVGKDWNWREVPLQDSTKLSKNFLCRKNLIQSPAAVHFMSSKKERNSMHHVHSFDFCSERFYVSSIEISRNDDSFDNPHYVKPCRWDDRFGLYEVVGNTARVQVLEDYKRGKWRKEEEVHLKFLKKKKKWRKDLALIHGWPHKILFGRWRKAFLYYPVAGAIVELPEEWLTDDGEYWPGVSPSLVEFNGMREASLHEVYKQFSSSFSKLTLE